MPFPPQTKLPFTKEGIEALWPNQHGCYGIFSDDKCVYIGKGDLRDRLLDHVNGDNLAILLYSPTYALTVVSEDADLLEKQLILEFSPICNKRVG